MKTERSETAFTKRSNVLRYVYDQKRSDIDGLELGAKKCLVIINHMTQKRISEFEITGNKLFVKMHDYSWYSLGFLTRAALSRAYNVLSNESSDLPIEDLFRTWKNSRNIFSFIEQDELLEELKYLKEAGLIEIKCNKPTPVRLARLSQIKSISLNGEGREQAIKIESEVASPELEKILKKPTPGVVYSNPLY